MTIELNNDERDTLLIVLGMAAATGSEERDPQSPSAIAHWQTRAGFVLGAQTGGRVKKIDELYAFVTVGDDGDEGIPAFTNGQWLLPMVGADMARVESFRVMAQALCNASGKPMKILRFSQAEQIGEVNPQ